MNIRFAPITTNDLGELKEIYNWYIKNSTATFHTEPIDVADFNEFLYIDHPLYKSFLIYADDVVAGYCFLTHYKKRQAYNRSAEVTLYLKPDYCHKGIGAVALQHLEQTARANGLKNIIGVITGDNGGSIRLFEKAGFEKCAHFKNVGEKFNKVLDVVSYQKEI